MGGRGFPSVYIIDAEGVKLAEFRPTSEADVRGALSRAQIKKDLMAMDQNDAAVKAGLELLGAMGSPFNADLEKMDKLAATPGLDKRILKLYPGFKAEVVWFKAYNDAQRAVGQPQSQAEAVLKMGQALYPSIKKLGMPTGLLRDAVLLMVLNEAVAKKDLDVAKAALGVVTERLKSIPDRFKAEASKDLGYEVGKKFVEEASKKKEAPKK